MGLCTQSANVAHQWHWWMCACRGTDPGHSHQSPPPTRRLKDHVCKPHPLLATSVVWLGMTAMMVGHRRVVAPAICGSIWLACEPILRVLRLWPPRLIVHCCGHPQHFLVSQDLQQKQDRPLMGHSRLLVPPPMAAEFVRILVLCAALLSVLGRERRPRARLAFLRTMPLLDCFPLVLARPLLAVFEVARWQRA